ncbi:MAG: ABC transporter ATP-binding protein [Acidobacteria bacterium]|nr:ABC transporter ATP-binding protein [Acidobacteriota bacterium]
MRPVYQVRDLAVVKDGRALISEIQLELFAGELVVILGPNGAGKSTLLRALAGIETVSAGEVLLGGKSITKIGRREMARQVAMVEPMLDLPFGYSVEQVVMMGRAPHMDAWFEGTEDWAQVDGALAVMDCQPLRKRDYRNLSSGEKQRVLVASALAQQPCVLLLDESAAFLDVRHQMELFEALKRLTAQGYLIVAVTHDWNLAAAWASRIILLKNGRVAAAGPPAELSNEALLLEVFGVPLEVMAVEGRPPVVLQPGATRR